MSNEPLDMRCATCKFWEPGAPALATATRDPAACSGEGACQVNPPQVIYANLRPTSYFPITTGDRFCSRWAGESDGPDGGEEIDDSTVVPFERAAA